MKILVLPSWYPPKGGRFFQELSEALLKENNSVDVLVNENSSIKNFNFDSFFNNNIHSDETGLNVYRSTFYNIPKLDFLSNKLWIKQTFKSYVKYAKQAGHPDIIHVHSSIWAGVVAQMINEKFSVPYVITEHRSRFIYNTDEAKKMLPKKFFPYIKKALKAASLITTVSPALSTKLIDIESSVKSKIITIPNTVDVNDFQFSEITEPKNDFIWFSLGNLTHVKGMDILLHAFSEVVKKSNKSVLLRIGGSGPEYNKLFQLRKKLKLGKNIAFLGNLTRKQVIKEMRNSHAFVLPSRFEAFGVVYIEAMSCGIPVVGTDAGGQTSIVNKDNGYLVEPENPKELTEAMDQMMKNYTSFNKQEIRDSVISKYEKSVVAKEYCKQFSKIVNG